MLRTDERHVNSRAGDSLSFQGPPWVRGARRHRPEGLSVWGARLAAPARSVLVGRRVHAQGDHIREVGCTPDSAGGRRVTLREAQARSEIRAVLRRPASRGPSNVGGRPHRADRVGEVGQKGCRSCPETGGCARPVVGQKDGWRRPSIARDCKRWPVREDVEECIWYSMRTALLQVRACRNLSSPVSGCRCTWSNFRRSSRRTTRMESSGFL